MRQSLNKTKNVIDKQEYTIDNIICDIMKICRGEDFYMVSVRNFNNSLIRKGEIDSKSSFILDDIADIRTGRRIENISFVHDHLGKKTKKEVNWDLRN